MKDMEFLTRRIEVLEKDIQMNVKLWRKCIEEVQRDLPVDCEKTYYLMHILNMLTDLEDYIDKGE